ncbi:DUF4430 domain-containing protein [Marinilactibacillus sp. Marseille-P9653]|uniref:DUF4430 domain-containing protein n=1 Tax=Marinilactibacillus sp. Marseille-P9653 TaxID=2866583 RepID=UPI001CE3CCFA|nr:DUF4430 domain-containing protein [Marinilactibacillus sp. Marseille-P9653]
MKKILGLCMLIFLVAGCGNQENASTESETSGNTQDQNEEVTYTIEFSIDDELYSVDEDEMNQELNSPKDTTLLEVMHEEFGAVDSDGFITAINGLEQKDDKKAYWLFDINGEFSQVGAGDYVLEEGDEITWKLETGQDEE